MVHHPFFFFFFILSASWFPTGTDSSNASINISKLLRHAQGPHEQLTVLHTTVCIAGWAESLGNDARIRVDAEVLALVSVSS